MLKRKVRMGFVFVLVAALTLTSVGTAFGSPSQALTPAQEVKVAGTGCDFVGGVAAGLGIATLGGCLFCGVGAAILGAGYYVACTK
jgi:hypothetical protein